jgi:predicted nucleic acid-binding protein
VTTDRPAAGILHTSVFIASKTRQLQTALIPDEVATTVITLAELNAGVLAARTAQCMRLDDNCDEAESSSRCNTGG